MKRVISKKDITLSLKIAIGSIAIILAETMHLNFATSSGIITLLSIVSTKWATVKLALNRVLSFVLTVVLSWITFTLIKNDWVAYSIFILLLVVICTIVQLQTTISVNAVIGTHFMATHNFTTASVFNELMLVLIGITVAIVLNLFHDNQNQKRLLKQDLLYIEQQMKEILISISLYLVEKEQHENVWHDIIVLEEHLSQSIERAKQYQDNTFVSHPEYYIKYIDMRMTQCNILHDLHFELNMIRTMPEQAKTVSEYVQYLSGLIAEHNVPDSQIERLHEIAEGFRSEDLPKTREEFEGRAMIYHIMIDLEEFLVAKKEFIMDLSEEQKAIYWNKEDKKSKI